MKIEEFYQAFLQGILSETDARGILKSEVFFEKICDFLVDDGELSNNYTQAECKKRGIDVSGYDYDEERKILTLINYTFFQEEEIQTLTQRMITSKFKNAENFLIKNEKKYYEDLEETSEEFSMAYYIYNKLINYEVGKVRFLILTDGKISPNVKEIPNKKYKKNNNIDLEYRIVDIDYIYKLQMSNFKNQNFNIEVDLPCIKASTNEEEYISYLAIIPGQTIADIYDKHGQRLLEQNVRTFLQFRGNVNKGLRNTIEYKPSMFFAYNNGITATASKVEINEKGNLGKIHDFQIVNGGQTTSAIYASWKNNKTDLSEVNVQMKLSIVLKHENQSEFVSKIAEYANTQNKINKSDFFSNSPFHKEMKDHSKRIWAPAVGGRQKKTRWYYERVRGEYLNEQAYLTQARKKAFQLENPKYQLIDKTFLSKSEMAWKKEPYTVSKGAQKCFAIFAEQVTKTLEKNQLAITEDYFKESVSKIIMFRHLEKSVSSAWWYNGGYRAQIIAYTLSYFSMMVDESKQFLDFKTIWKEQKVSDELSGLLMKISEKLYPVLLEASEGDANVGTWAKKKQCWEKLKKIEIGVKIPSKLLLDTETAKTEKKYQKKEKRMAKGIEAQIFVVEYLNWEKIYIHYEKYKDFSSITESQFDILKKMANGSLFPSEKQSKVLYEIYEHAKKEAVVE